MIKKELISYLDLPFFNALTKEYISPKKIDNLPKFPTLEDIISQAEIKKKAFSQSQRDILVESLDFQYKDLVLTETQNQNLSSLKDNNTFTITAGHQLNLAMGPVLTVYKLISTIKLAEVLNKKNTKYKFVPIYWMATEDHDFEEINHFYTKDKKYSWDIDSQQIPVGDLPTVKIEEVFENFEKENWFTSENEKLWLDIFKKAYSTSKSLKEAHRRLIQEIFSSYGLLCLDANNESFKDSFKDVIKDELLEQKSYEFAYPVYKELKEKISVKIPEPRKTNLFYLKNKIRERIDWDDKSKELFIIDNKNDSDLSIKQSLDDNPHFFSPNVILRPIYQEFILPNVAFVGGDSEVGYWLQLTNLFAQYNIPFPRLVVRNLIHFEENTTTEIRKKHNICIKDIVTKTSDELVKEKICSKKEYKDWENWKSEFENQLSKWSEENKRFVSNNEITKAWQKKMLNTVENYMNKKVRNNYKSKEKPLSDAILQVKQKYFNSSGSLFERKKGILDIVNIKDDFIPFLLENTDVLSKDLEVYILD